MLETAGSPENKAKYDETGAEWLLVADVVLKKINRMRPDSVLS